MTTYADKEYVKWIRGLYPYDHAKCGVCATMHATGWCIDSTHQAMADAGRKAQLNPNSITPAMRSRILAFRKKFARFYPKRGK